MHDFHAEDWFELGGKWVAATTAARAYSRDGVFNEIRAHGFTIDGREYTLVGVERFLPSTPIRPGEKIGLIVKESPHQTGSPQS